jgi:uncharacterized protein YecE (DUF72 family)
MAKILVGTCSWTDKELIEAGTFYPLEANTVEKRLRYYASQFPLVELDSCYYAMPSERTSQLWVDRTPPGFTFNIKSFSLFTHHPTKVSACPSDIAKSLPPRPEGKPNLYYRDVPLELQEELWRRFSKAIAPLYAAGKLGVVLLQFPKWVHPSSMTKDYILEAREWLSPYSVAVEFRSVSWFGDKAEKATLKFLNEHKLPYVCVDEPQGFKSSVPPVAEATADLALVRFHGRNADTWEKPGLTPSQRFDWYYKAEELQEWLPRIQLLAEKTNSVHLLVNTNHRDQGIVNARLLESIITQTSFSLG